MDYEIDLLKKMQGLKQVGKYVQEYIKEIYRVLIIISHVEADKKKVVCHHNGLQLSIEEDPSLVQVTSIKEMY